MLKRLLDLLFTVILVAATALPAMAVTIDASSSMVLSNMSDEDQLRFLESQGINVPGAYADYRHYYEYGDKCVCGYFLSTTWTSVACSGPPCSTVMGITPTPEVG